jgi:hypothetical protein
MFFRFGGNSWPTKLNLSKGIAGIALVEMYMFLVVVGGMEWLMGKDLLGVLSNPIIFLTYTALYIVNRFLIIKYQGVVYAEELRHFNRFKRFLLFFISAVMILVTIALFIFFASVHKAHISVK